MNEICGKHVRSTLEELLDPKTCALVVIDMQRGAFADSGAAGRAGHEVSMMQAIAPRCGRMIEAARARGVRVIHIRVANLPDGMSSSPAWLRSLITIGGDHPVDPGALSIEGTWETEFCDECTPEPNESVVTKRRPSAFIGTDLELLLRSAGVESVAVVGIATPGCVEATIRDAAHRDFYTVLIEDCVAAYDVELHEAALTVMRARHDCCTIDEAVAAWDRIEAAALA